MGIKINTYAYQPLKALIQRNTFSKSVSYGTGISLDYVYNFSSYPADSIRYVITDNIIRGEKGTSNSRGIQSNFYSGPQSVEISNNTLRSTAGIYLYSEKASKVKILNNTIDSSYANGIHLDRLSGKIQGNTITNNGWYDSWGVYLTSDFNYPSLDSIINNTISGNGNVNSPTSTTTSPSRGGISINGSTVALINNNNLVDNNSFDVVNQVTEAVAAQQNAKFNYWGATTTTAIALGGNPKNLDRIHDKYDDNAKGFVNYGGYLNGPSPTGTPTSQSESGQVRFTNRLGALVLTYGLTDSIHMRVADADRNLAPAALDTVSVRISTLKEPLGEKITLTETGINTGIFGGILRFESQMESKKYVEQDW
jgi:parallel beta-helix repeat protein